MLSYSCHLSTAKPFCNLTIIYWSQWNSYQKKNMSFHKTLQWTSVKWLYSTLLRWILQKTNSNIHFFKCQVTNFNSSISKKICVAKRNFMIKLKNQEGNHHGKSTTHIKYSTYVNVWLITRLYNITNAWLITLLTAILTFLQ